MNEEMMEVMNEEENYDVSVPEEAGGDGISKGEIAIVGLAAVGFGFLIKKGYDLGKAGVNKVKNLIAEKKASKSKDEPAEEPEKVEGEVEDKK
ncbi:MAG: hypothetical protein J6Y02_01140 [Pseudobutyrivibrio sp.]|nr:hypothetical protein [Pseudobutyrivibrio sp.]